VTVDVKLGVEGKLYSTQIIDSRINLMVEGLRSLKFLLFHCL